jgi:hypothetical protein
MPVIIDKITDLSDLSGTPANDGEVPVYDATAAVFRVLPTAASPQAIKIGNYLFSGYYTGRSSGSVTAGAAVSLLLLAPFRILRRWTFDRIGVGVNFTNTAAGNFRLGLWAASPSTGLPTGSPLLDSGAIAFAASGSGAYESTISYTPSRTLPLCWSGVLTTVSSGTFGTINGHAAGPLLDAFGSSLVSGVPYCLTVSGLSASNALPDLTSGTFTDGFTAAPFFWLRRSA